MKTEVVLKEFIRVAYQQSRGTGAYVKNSYFHVGLSCDSGLRITGSWKIPD